MLWMPAAICTKTTYLYSRNVSQSLPNGDQRFRIEWFPGRRLTHRL
jgi:hypothetical protein